jgi:hypothetical protein
MVEKDEEEYCYYKSLRELPNKKRLPTNINPGFVMEVNGIEIFVS